MSKKTLALETVKSDLAAGISDEDLMYKYDLSPGGLQALFDKLIRAMANGTSHVQIESE
jgi:uncharacterized protein (DUF433 family)